MEEKAEQLNAEAWRQGKPFIVVQGVPLRTISPSEYTQMRIRAELQSAVRKVFEVKA